MTNRLLLTSALAASLILFTGCDGSRTSDYPDHSATTTRRVDDIKQNARDQRDAVDVEYDRVTTTLDFNERQIREKYKARRQTFINEMNAEMAGRDAKTRDILIQAKHDKDVIDAEVASKLLTTPPDQAAEIQADATSRKSAIDNETTSKLAPLVSDTESRKAKDIMRGLEIDRDESQEISALEQDRSKARNVMNEKKLKIDTWTNEELAKVGKDSRSANK